MVTKLAASAILDLIRNAGLRPHLRPMESESAFEQDLQVIHVHNKCGEELA